MLLLLRSCCCLRCSTVLAEFADGAFSSISSTWSNHFRSPGVFSPAVSFSIATLSFSYLLHLAICCPCAALELLLLCPVVAAALNDVIFISNDNFSSLSHGTFLHHQRPPYPSTSASSLLCIICRCCCCLGRLR